MARGDSALVPPAMVSMDFFTVPTITMKVRFVFLVLEHRRREAFECDGASL
jgi:hypothetical protein